VAALSLSLTACGGGSSSGPSGQAQNTTPSSVKGTVAYGHPVVSGSVVAIDVNGNKCGSATTASDGTYSMSTNCAPGPVEIAVISGAPNNIPLMTLAIPSDGNSPVSGTVNITPLTTSIAYYFLGTQPLVGSLQSPSSFAQAVAYVPMVLTAAYQQKGASAAFAAINSAYQGAAQQVLSALSQSLATYGVSNSSDFNPVTTPFSANGKDVDAFFDAYPETVTGSNNLQLGANTQPLLSVTFSGAPNSPATLGGSAVALPSTVALPSAFSNVSSYAVYGLYGTSTQRNSGTLSNVSSTQATLALGDPLNFDGATTPTSTTITVDANQNTTSVTQFAASAALRSNGQVIEMCQRITNGSNYIKSMMIAVANTATPVPVTSLEGKTFYDLEDCVFTNNGPGTTDINNVSTANNDYMTVNSDGSATFYANKGPGAGASLVATADSASIAAALGSGGTNIAIDASSGVAYPSTTGTVGNITWHAYSIPKVGGGVRYIIVQQVTPTNGSSTSPNRGFVGIWVTQ
jgi:hypothetical protein